MNSVITVRTHTACSPTYHRVYRPCLTLLMATGLIGLAVTPASAQYANAIIQPPSPQHPIPEYPAVETAPPGLPPASAVNMRFGEHTANYIPALRTSSDGRVAMGYSPSGQRVIFHLFRPEAYTAAASQLSSELNPADDASGFLSEAFVFPLDGSGSGGLDFALASQTGSGQTLIEAEAFRHHALCDGSSLEPGGTANPRVCVDSVSGQALDCYHLTVIISVRKDREAGVSGSYDTELFQVPIIVSVRNPKTKDATIASVTSPLSGSTLSPALTIENTGSFFEPVFDRTGRLFVSRLGAAPGIAGANEPVDIVYAVAPETAAPCDISAWSRWDASDTTGLRPVSLANGDPAVYLGGQVGGAPRFGFAAYPIRDTEGNTITPGDDVMATYPWIDRDGDNLLMTTVHSTLHYMEAGHPGTTIADVFTRYPARPAPFLVTTPQGVLSLTADPLHQYDPLHGPLLDLLPPSSKNSTFDLLFNIEEDSEKRGVVVAGLWTRGKMVLLDGRLNNSDYGLRPEDALHREIELYEPLTDHEEAADGFVRVGSGTATGWLMGLGSLTFSPKSNAYPGNAAVIDSIENLLVHDENFQPGTPRDVVWQVSRGDSMDEVAFDDYLHPDAFILSSMTASVTFSDADGVGSGPIKLEDYNRMTYHDGFQERSTAFQTDIGSGGEWSAPIRLQNAATTLPDTWNVPTAGLGDGVRMEPIARGGAQGKGLWLDGQGRVTYSIPPQPQSMANHSWYVGIHVDARLEDDMTRRLLTFPDGSGLNLRGPDRLEFSRRGGTVFHTLVLPPELSFSSRSWRHIGLNIAAGSTSIEILIDGLPVDEWSCEQPADSSTGVIAFLTGLFINPSAPQTLDCQPAFGMRPGTLTLGRRGTATGLRGWVDDLVVFATHPGPEVSCNHARGTLVRINGSVDAALLSKASAYPASTHAAIDQLTDSTGGTYLCYREDDPSTTSLRTLPSTVHSLREQITFPEHAQFEAGTPRPDSTANAFCLSCHTASAPMGLALDALAPLTLALEDDVRRQPSQAPMRIGGVIPAGWLPNGQPLATVHAPPEGFPIDEWLHPVAP